MKKLLILLLLGLSFGYNPKGNGDAFFINIPSTYNVEYNVTSDLTGKVYHRKYVGSYYSIPAKSSELNYLGLVIPIEELELWKARVREVFKLN